MHLNASRKRSQAVQKAAAITGLSLLALAAVVSPASAASKQSAHASVRFASIGKPIFAAPIKGKCAPGTVKVKNPKTQILHWKAPTSANITTKRVTKGVTVCRLTTRTGSPVKGTTDSGGVLVALPSTFPANPTVQDIAALGLTSSTPVASTLRIPQPTGQPFVSTSLARKVRPVAVVGTQTLSIPDGVDTVTVPAAIVEWEFTGGSGVLVYPSAEVGSNGAPVMRYVKLDPEGSVRVQQSVPLTPREEAGGRAYRFFSGRIVPDYGQSNLPPSTFKNWELPAAQDTSGVGTPVGIAANSGYYDDRNPAPRDGFVYLDPATGTLVGRYDY